MRIISDFTDYYDAVGKGVRDPGDVTFVRRQRIIDAHVNDPIALRDRAAFPFALFGQVPTAQYLSEPNILRHFVAFCGRGYLVFEVNGIFFPDLDTMFDALSDGSAAKKIVDISHRYYEDHIKTVVATKVARAHRSFVDSYEADKYDRWDAFPFNRKGWARFIKSRGGTTVSLGDEIHRRLGSPVVLFSEPSYSFSSVMKINPRLQDINFAVHVDPYTAYQEIDMYIGNVLTKQVDPVPTRTQELIRDAHGFDDMSFKGPGPGEKKSRRRANKARKQSELCEQDASTQGSQTQG